MAGGDKKLRVSQFELSGERLPVACDILTSTRPSQIRTVHRNHWVVMDFGFSSETEREFRDYSLRDFNVGG